MATYRLNVNGRQREVTTDPSTPLLWVLRDELKRAIILQLRRRKRWWHERALVEPEKNKVGAGRGFAAFPAEKIFESLFPAPGRGKKGQLRKLPKENEPCPKGANQAQDEQAVAAQPVHVAILGKVPFASKLKFSRSSGAFVAAASWSACLSGADFRQKRRDSAALHNARVDRENVCHRK